MPYGRNRCLDPEGTTVRAVRPTVLTLAAALALAACSSSAGDTPSSSAPGGSSSAGSQAPEDITTTAAAVSTGLTKIVVLAGRISAGATNSPDEGKKLSKGLEPLWRPIEGTVKKNDPDTYLSIEDAFAELESGDPAKSAKASADLTGVVARYLAKNPG